uniref:growth arrest-specific protein 7 n=1 Tax=Ciona intestinalis TaxID=7719 RepID=UPI00005227AB|nr:growth arrest-specific protein 7 [Ciona intestinalis]|eukprot:XP_002123389.1 growth arrest-specific protein 7 [Ciona intestinalis]
MAEINCKALYSYDGSGGGEITTLQFDPGDVIKLLFSGENGWWEGEIGDKRGWFPASYVSKLEDEEALPAGWEAISTPNGEKYYVNTKTNETTWEIPKNEISNTTTNNGNDIGLHLELSSVIKKKEVELNLKDSPAPQCTGSEPSTPAPKSSSPITPRSKTQPSTPQTKASPAPLRARTPSTPTTPNQTNGHGNRPRIRMVNGISFPDEKEAKEQTLLQPGKYSYCDYFWGDKVENHTVQTGFCILYQKMLKEKQISKEMADLFKQREALETQYSKGLSAIANSVLAAQEEGTLGETWKQVKQATLQEAKIHLDFANKIRLQVEKPLLDHKEGGKKEFKKLEADVAELRKQVQLKYLAAERAKHMLLERTKDLEGKMNSTKHTKEDVQKARRKSTKHGEELSHSIELYNHARQQWFEEMVTSSVTMETHEAKRINAIKDILTKYTKLLQDTNTKCQKACDVINQNVAKTDADKDRELWVSKNQTGKVRPVDLII